MEKGKEPLSSAEIHSAIEPAVGRSLVLNQEAMDKVRPMLASSFNEWGRTMAWPASRARVDRTATEVPFFFDALCASLVGLLPRRSCVVRLARLGPSQEC